MSPLTVAEVRVHEALRNINDAYEGLPISEVISLASRGHKPARNLIKEYRAANRERRRAEKMETKEDGI